MGQISGHMPEGTCEGGWHLPLGRNFCGVCQVQARSGAGEEGFGGLKMLPFQGILFTDSRCLFIDLFRDVFGIILGVGGGSGQTPAAGGQSSILSSRTLRCPELNRKPWSGAADLHLEDTGGP